MASHKLSAVPNDPFGRTSRPRGIDRVGRVAMLAEVAEALQAGRLPASAEARMFVAGAIQSYLQSGGSLERDHLRLTAPRGSHAVPSRVYAASSPMNDAE